MSELIYFAHGNGFPALCYSQMLSELASHFKYCYIDKIGHNPLYPVDDNWSHLVAELIHSVQSQADKPVIALGHSLGGVLSLMAAIKEPSLFKAVILLDSPLIGPFKSNMIRLAKALGVIDRITPAYRTKGRKERWENKTQLISYLRTRPLFKTFTDECLEDYITYGLEKGPEGYCLRFDRHIEYQIYRTIPHDLPQLKGKLTVPSALIYGDASTVIDPADRRYMSSHFGIKIQKIKGSHLFPMETPQLAAKQITHVIEKLLGKLKEA